ncbi:Tim44/TimA family putative adaptor protein [Roseospira visakhapatnamensis]|uniref:Putative lipid-binding transport protein (Tim44 family) n=1 Tax=Roseospira visakhapatnamensis TaxID=390880 RepID=A0A7W6W980_9PROT|nr:Tim44/TimA family putative adaptor protein [Roseospira visakhapatnamensis]MBB4265172.1 putative lipid-binding transport protein (Tim44 family) [Roseospira visakhapatnamensis]
MDDSFQFIDIIFFAMIAAFLVLRLRSVLGRRTGNEKPREPGVGGRLGRMGRPEEDKVIDLPGRRRPEGVADEDDRRVDAPARVRGRASAVSGMDAVMRVDPDFETESFLAGARGAFEMIVAAFANGDKETLQPLLADSVFRNFAAAIDEREAAGETMETELLGIKSIALEDGRVEDHVAHVTVAFVTEQINVVRDRDGAVVDGDPDHIAKVTDLWTFARDTTSADPNWLLVATRTPEDD